MGNYAKCLALSTFLLLVACAEDPGEECRALIEAQEFQRASERCTGAWRATAEPSFGVLAARASGQLDDVAAVRAWGERLEGSSGEPEVQSVLAGLHRRHGELDSAAEAYRRQVETARRLGIPAQAARGHYGLFYLAWERSELQVALEQAALAYDAARQAENRELAAVAIQAIFNLRYDLGDLEGAERALDRAETLLPEGDAASTSRQLAFRCALQLDRNRLRLAADFCRRALQEAGDGAGRSFLRSTHLNLVKIHLELGELAAAERYLEAALAEREPDGSRSTALDYYQARLRMAQGRSSEALEAVERALADDPVPDWKWDLEYLHGRLLEGSDSEAAERAYLRSLEILEELRRDLGFDELKPWLLEKRRRPFEALFTLRAREGRTIEALATAERAQARDFLDAFIAATTLETPPRSGTIRPVGEDDTTSESGARRRSALDRLLPDLGISPLVAPRSGTELAAVVGERLVGRQILMYFRTRERLWVFSFADGLRLEPLSIPFAELEAMVSRWSADVENLELAEALGHRLLPDGLSGKAGHLVLVTDGRLGAIPFAALRLDGEALVERFTLSQVPSLEALLALEDLARAEREDDVVRGDAEAGELLVLGDPRGDLPAAADEARWVAEWLGTRPRVGDEMVVEALTGTSEIDVLHFATHSGLGPSGPWLALAGAELEAAEVLARRLDARLVVLASCASGARTGRGLWGSMGGAFLAAGSSAVLVSHGSIDDRATRRFIERFYLEGGAGDPAGALARAQRVSIDAGEPAEVWAAFALIGLHDFHETPNRKDP